MIFTLSVPISLIFSMLSFISDNVNLIISAFWIWLTEATFDILPRLNEVKFGSGLIDELLFLDLPRETRFPSGCGDVRIYKSSSRKCV